MLELVFMAPIKRPLSRENTSPSQKMMSFFAGSVSSLEWDPFVSLRPSFQLLWCGPFIDLLPGTHQDQGHLRKNRIGGCVAERPSLSRSEATFLVFLTTPGPESGPQKNIGTLSCPMGCDKIKGSKRANHCGLMTRADHKKGHPPGFLFKGVQRRANQEKGFLATTIKGSPLQSPG